ncbi:MAG: hypothetical protein AB7G93_05875 [Bdellovibrionales bacterium]
MSLEQLTQFIKQIREADIESDADFHAIAQASEELLLLSDKELGRELRVSRPTVSRWRAGVTAPVPFARKMVYDYLMKRTRQAIKMKKVKVKVKSKPKSRVGIQNSEPRAAKAQS